MSEDETDWMPRRAPNAEHFVNWLAHLAFMIWPVSSLMRTCPKWLIVRAILYANDARYYVSPQTDGAVS